MVTLYMEGAGKREQDIQLRKSMRSFLEKELGDQAKKIKIIPSGHQNDTIKNFKQHNDPEKTAYLLVDSEQEITASTTAILHLQNKQPTYRKLWKETADKQVHLMVQKMESWFLADLEGLRKFYGDSPAQLKPPQNVETLSKKEVDAVLRTCIKFTKKKQYEKSHGHVLLGYINPKKVRKASYFCNHFFSTLEDHLKEPHA